MDPLDAGQPQELIVTRSLQAAPTQYQPLRLLPSLAASSHENIVSV